MTLVGAAGLAAPGGCGGSGVGRLPDAGADAAVEPAAGDGGGDAEGSGGSAGQGPDRSAAGVAGDPGQPATGGSAIGSGGSAVTGSGGAITAGAAGTGGVGGSAGTVLTYDCENPAVADGTLPLIIDFESASLDEYGVSFELASAPGAYGGTYAYAEEAAAGAIFYEFVPGPDSDTALSVTIPESTEWGGGFGFWISGCPDVSVFSGITFALRSNVASGEVPVSFQTVDTLPVAYDGFCDAPDTTGCVHASISITVTNEWATYQLAWNDFSDGMAGTTAVPVDGTNWYGLEFGIPGVYDTPEDLVLAIDDFGFY